MMKKVLLGFSFVALLAGCVSVSSQQVVLPDGEVLSTHETKARFEGLKEVPCQHLTADCPDACEHGGVYALFSIVEYVDYKALSEYGDPKQDEFAVRVKLRNGKPAPETAPAVRLVIQHLDVGQTVNLDWAHIYCTTETANYPERIITRLAE